MIDTIFFDLDNTLLDFNQAERIALTRALSEMGIKPEEIILKRYSQLNLEQWKLLEQGKLSRGQVKIRRFQLLFEEMDIRHEPETAARLYESYLGAGHYFMEGAQELLRNLYGRYRLYLVTNGTAHVQKSRLKSAGIGPYFQEIFISEEVGFSKPDKAYFERCFARIPNFKKEASVIVGDSLSSDIQGGINAGIKTIWFHGEEDSNTSRVKADYEIKRLDQLEPLLEGL